jgi:hypothetical protein
MDPVPGKQRVPGGGRRACAVLLACCCTLVASCGGADSGPPTQPQPEAQPAAPVPPGTPAALRALSGRTMVTLNPQPAAADAAVPAATVAVARDANGNLQLTQRDGMTRTLSPDGKVTLHAAGTAAQVHSELPQSLIVAVDAANTVHVVDPEACVALRVAADGRVSTTFLPPAATGRRCEAGPRAR